MNQELIDALRKVSKHMSAQYHDTGTEEAFRLLANALEGKKIYMNPIREGMDRLPGRWHKGSLSDGAGNFCGVGHMANVLTGEEVTRENHLGQLPEQEYRQFEAARDLMSKVAKEQFPERVTSFQGTFAEFNDHEKTTEPEVILVMDKAAVLWDEQV